MFTLRVFLMGLVILSPETDRDGNWTTLTILMPNVQARECMEAHHPVLICDPHSKGCDKCDDGDEIAQRLRLNQAPHGKLLSGVDIIITPAPIGTLEPVEGLHEPKWWHAWIGAIPDSDTLKDIFWIPRLSEVAPAAGGIDTRFRGPAENIAPTEVAARLRLRNGKVKVFGVADVEHEVLSTTFKTSDVPVLRGLKQALADIVVVDLTIDGAYVEIYGSRLGTKMSTADRLFRLAPADGSKIVEVLMGNLTPLQRIIDPTEAAGHFMLYEDFSAEPVNFPIPHPGRGRPASAVEQQQCPPPVVLAVSGPCSGTPLETKCSPRDPSQGGTSRPICTILLMD